MKGTDYEIDEARGRIYLKSEAVSGDDGCRVSYTPAKGRPKRGIVKASSSPREVLAAVRYIEDADTGEGRDYYAPKCSIGPSGEFALKSRDTEQQISLVCSILDPGGARAALWIDGEAA